MNFRILLCWLSEYFDVEFEKCAEENAAQRSKAGFWSILAILKWKINKFLKKIFLSANLCFQWFPLWYSVGGLNDDNFSVWFKQFYSSWRIRHTNKIFTGIQSKSFNWFGGKTQYYVQSNNTQCVFYTLRSTRSHILRECSVCVKKRQDTKKPERKREKDAHDNEGHFNFIV